MTRPSASFPDRRLEFVSSAQMSVDAQAALGSPTMNTFHLIGDTALILVGLAFALAGYVLGYFAIILGLLFLFVSQVAPFQRLMVRDSSSIALCGSSVL